MTKRQWKNRQMIWRRSHRKEDLEEEEAKGEETQVKKDVGEGNMQEERSEGLRKKKGRECGQGKVK